MSPPQSGDSKYVLATFSALCGAWLTQCISHLRTKQGTSIFKRSLAEKLFFFFLVTTESTSEKSGLYFLETHESHCTVNAFQDKEAFFCFSFVKRHFFVFFCKAESVVSDAAPPGWQCHVAQLPQIQTVVTRQDKARHEEVRRTFKGTPTVKAGAPCEINAGIGVISAIWK